MIKIFLRLVAPVLTACLFCSGQIQAAMPVKAALLVNMASGKILYERNADLQIPPASLTKIMTMYLALDAVRAKKININQKIRINSIAAGIGGSSMRLNAGEKVPVVRLLAGMAVSSGNDAAMALAQSLGGNIKNFTRQMNNRARKLGMRLTVFRNPTGLPAAGQKTTARDMMRLCMAYLRDHPEARRFHSIKYFMHKGSVARNTNPLLGYVQGVDGLKTGWTVASGYNLIITAKRGKTRLLAIILGASNKKGRDDLAKQLLSAGFRYPQRADMVRKMMGSRKPR